MNMRCNNCGKAILESSKFCEYCGNKIISHSSSSLGEKVTNKEDSNFNKLVTHLEFLGYSVGDNGSEGELIKVLASHKTKNNLVINFTSAAGFVIYSFFRINCDKATKQKAKLLEIINKMNNGTYLTAFSLTEGDEPSIICGSWYPPEYCKSTFAIFLDMFENDIARGFKTDGFMDFA